MPHAIADSDDDGGSDIMGDGEVGNPDGVMTMEMAMAALPSANGSEGRSVGTDSTERLRRQMLEAESGFMATNSRSAPGIATTGAMGSSASPSVEQSRKRRHTGLPPSPEAKKAKGGIMRTYTTKRRRVEDEDEDDEIDAVAPKTSQSVRFSEHSGVRSSTESLPTGSIMKDFVMHEPQVMFRDSGSTVEDSASLQVRLLEGVVRSEGVGGDGGGDEGGTPRPSSSLGWLNGTEEARRGKKAVEGAEQHTTGAWGNGESAADDQQSRTPDADKEKLSRLVAGLIESDRRAQAQQSPSHPVETLAEERPRASPVVEIRTAAIKATDSLSAIESATANGSTQKSGRGRKRKFDPEKVEVVLDPADLFSGLPKENYVPRPSRRRATAVEETAIDYSVRPEKAAKAKRTKTATQVSARAEEIDLSALKAAASEQAKASTANAEKNAEKVLSPSQVSKDDSQPQSASHTKSSASQRQHKSKEQHRRTIQQPDDAQLDGADTTIAVKPAEERAKPKADSEIFIKPALPTPKPKASTKAKRSHTTIFEDHVEFVRSQRSSPSLSQQQAKRKSALQISQEKANGANQKKRRFVVIDDDEDDEDELAKAEEAQEEVAVEKRSRGQPAKKTAKPAAKSKETVDDSDGGDEPAATKKTAEKPARKSSSKGNASKQAAETASDKENEPGPPAEQAESTESSGNAASQTSKGTTNATENPDEHTTPVDKAADLSEKTVLTPSPDKAAAPPAKVEKPSPTSHSPIKSSSKVPLRVGLSKRSRIPPLLRMGKPVIPAARR